jgi:photosystem II stability/assembly factor-like uncharacterized protein
MTIENLSACEHGIPAHTLSAWRDGDLPAGEAQRIAAHIAECAASRARLADYDALLQVLRAQRVPPADERLWPAVRMRISQTRAGTPMHTGNTARRLLGALGALAAVLALLLGFALLLSRGSVSHPSAFTPARATATLRPTIVTGWSQTALPAGFTLSGSSLAIAPSDGTTAYACVTAQDASQNLKPGLSANQIWVTHDRGARWSRMTDSPGSPVNQCSLQVDALNPAIVVASGRSIPLYSTPPAGTPPALFGHGGGGFAAVTFNGGRTWQQPTGDAAPGGTHELATHGGTTYAVRCCYAVPASAERLMVSRDAMRSWRPVDAAIVAAGQGIDAFFYRSDTGGLLATAFDVNTLNRHLWRSTDGGTHWSELPSPATSFVDVYVIQQPASGHPWLLCAETFKPVHSAETDPGPPTGIVCSTDGGDHWASRPRPDVSGSGFTLLGITNSGDLLAQANGSGADTLYRLAAGGDQWQTFDTAPGSDVSTTYIPSPGAGLLWALPVQAFYSPLDPTGRIYTKDYAA